MLSSGTSPIYSCDFMKTCPSLGGYKRDGAVIWPRDKSVCVGVCRKGIEGGLLVYMYMPLSQCDRQRMSRKPPTETALRWMRRLTCVCMQLCLCGDFVNIPAEHCAYVCVCVYVSSKDIELRVFTCCLL